MASQAPATLADVAREAGVSLATASRALNGSARTVRADSRERVVAAAERLGYVANAQAQAVARGTTATVVLIVSDIADPFFSSIAAGAIRRADEAGLVVTITVTDRDPAREQRAIRTLRSQRPRGVLLVGSRPENTDHDAVAAELAALVAHGSRVVLVGSDELPFPAVAVDDLAAGASLADTLADLGYRAPLVLTGPAGLATARHRSQGFLDRARERGLRPVAVPSGMHRAAGLAAVEALDDAVLADRDALVAVTDVLAMGALAGLRARGASIAVAGFDDIPQAVDVVPALTTVRMPLEAMGSRAIELVLGDGSGSEGVERMPTSVVARESTPAR